MKYFYMILFFLFLVMIVLAVKSQKNEKPGKTLLVFKYSSAAKALRYVVGVVFVLYIFALLYQFIYVNKNISENIFQALFWMSWAYFMLITQGRKSTASEQGISHMGNFYTWKSISYWKWSQNNKNIIISAVSKRKTLTPSTFQIKVTESDRAKANEIFTKYAGKPKHN